MSQVRKVWTPLCKHLLAILPINLLLKSEYLFNNRYIAFESYVMEQNNRGRTVKLILSLRRSLEESNTPGSP